MKPGGTRARTNPKTRDAELERLAAHLKTEAAQPPLSVAADVVARWVRLQPPETAVLHLHRLQLVGPLDLSGLDATGASLVLEQVTTDAAVNMDRARLGKLAILDCRLVQTTLEDARVRTVRLADTRIGSRLSFNGARLDRLTLENMRVRGAVSLRGTEVTRDLTVTHSRAGTGKYALQGDGLNVGHSLRLGVGVVLDGLVDLDAVRVRDLIVADGAVLGRLSLRRTKLGLLVVEGGAEITDGLSAAGLEVEGDVRLGGVVRAKASGVAVDIRETRIGGDLELEDSFVALGGIRLSGVETRGHARFAGETQGAEAAALDVSRLSCARLAVMFRQTSGAVSVRQTNCTGLVLTGRHDGAVAAPLHLGVACAGRVVIGGAQTRIGGALSLIGLSCEELDLGDIEIVAHEDGPWRGMALAARHVRVGAVTRIGREGAATHIRGLTALDHARLGDTVRFHDVRITAACTAIGDCADPAALSMRQVSCSADVHLGGLEADGTIDLTGLDCGGDLILASLALSTGASSRLELAKARIGGALLVRGLRLEGSWSINAEGLETALLDDDAGLAWGQSPVRYVGMTYASLADLNGAESVGTAVRRRLAWLDANACAAHARGAAFSPQPYRAFIAALSTAGLGEEVKRVETVALRRRRRWGGAGPVQRLGSGLLDLISGYGHSPARATAALAAYFLIGWAGVSIADRVGAFETSPFIDGLVLEANRASTPEGCPWLEPPLYALDLIVPLTTLGTESFCTVRASHRPWIWAMVGYRLFGWILISIALLTYSGILRRNGAD